MYVSLWIINPDVLFALYLKSNNNTLDESIILEVD